MKLFLITIFVASPKILPLLILFRLRNIIYFWQTTSGLFFSIFILIKFSQEMLIQVLYQKFKDIICHLIQCDTIVELFFIQLEWDLGKDMNLRVDFFRILVKIKEFDSFYSSIFMCSWSVELTGSLFPRYVLAEVFQWQIESSVNQTHFSFQGFY